MVGEEIPPVGVDISPAGGDDPLAGELITLEEARSYLGIRTAFRDGDIIRAVKAARERVETMTGHVLVQRVFVETVAGFLDGVEARALIHKPFVEIERVQYSDEEGDLVDLVPLARGIERVSGFYLAPARGASWPQVGRDGVVKVHYLAGYDRGQVPEVLIQAAYLLVGHWFEHHEAGVVGHTSTEIPFGVTNICRDFRGGGMA